AGGSRTRRMPAARSLAFACAACRIALQLPCQRRSDPELPEFRGSPATSARPACIPACRSSILLAAFCMAEEGSMTRDELVELSDLNYAEAMRDLSRRAGGAVLDEDGLLLFTGGHPLPVLANATMRTDRRLGGAEVLERARVFFGARG